MNKKISIPCSIMALTLFTATSSFAVDLDDDDNNNSNWSLGLGIGYEVEKSLFKYSDDDSGFFPFPLIEYTAGPFTLSPFGVEAELYSVEKGDWEFELGSAIDISYDSGRDETDSRIFAGMDERKESSDLILEAELTTPVGIFGLEAAQDISSTHKGQWVDLSYTLPLYFTEKTIFAVGTGVEISSKKYIDYYYGVKSNEVTAERSAYTGDTATSPYVGYFFQHQLSKHFSLMHETKYSKVADEIRLSPLTKNEDSLLSSNIILMYSY